MIPWSVSKAERCAAFLLIIFICCSSYASFYSSNALMMKLEEKDGLDMGGYELESFQGTDILYLDGNEVSRRVSDGSAVRIEEDGVVVNIVGYDGQGRPGYRFEDGIESRYSYTEDGLLFSVSVTGPDGLEDVKQYYHSPSGDIVRMDSSDGGVYLFPGPSLFSFSLGDEMHVFSSMEEKAAPDDDGTVFTSLDDGGMEAVRPDGSVVRYDAEGRIVGLSSGGRVSSYTYFPDGGLESVSTVFDGCTELETYGEDGVLVSRLTSYPGGRAVREDFSDNVRVETRYRDSSPYVRIVYEADMKTVKEVVRL